jgi:hypothetical protein
MNVENIKKVRDVIANLPPERFNMAALFVVDGKAVMPERKSPVKLVESCGTAACIAGWTLATFRQPKHSDAFEAGNLLDLNYMQRDDLFTPVGYDEGEYTHAQAVAVLDHLIATGEVDWSVAEQVPA